MSWFGFAAACSVALQYAGRPMRLVLLAALQLCAAAMQHVQTPLGAQAVGFCLWDLKHTKHVNFSLI
jgi:hypothetical protein